MGYLSLPMAKLSDSFEAGVFGWKPERNLSQEWRIVLFLEDRNSYYQPQDFKKNFC